MGLSEEQKNLLQMRYEVWGVERVREELERDDRNLFAHPGVTAFARAWLKVTEERQRRSARLFRFSTIVVVVLSGAVLILGLVV